MHLPVNFIYSCCMWHTKFIYIYMCNYQSPEQCALLIITKMALWQFMHLHYALRYLLVEHSLVHWYQQCATLHHLIKRMSCHKAILVTTEIIFFVIWVYILCDLISTHFQLLKFLWNNVPESNISPQEGF